MSKYDKTLVFRSGSWYSEEDIHYLPDRMFTNYYYFRFNHEEPEIEKPWLCNMNFTATIKTEIIHEQV